MNRVPETVIVHGTLPQGKAVDGSGRSTLFLPMLIGVLLLPAILGSSQTIFNDGDVSWHIASGRWMLEHQAIPRTDPFSFTWAGKPWVPIEWLAEVIYASAYMVAAYAGIAAVVTAALIALNALVFFEAARSVRHPLPILLGMDVVLLPMILARPHLLAWPLLALWIAILLRARERDKAPPPWSALLMTVWANLHGSFVFGLAIAAAFGLEALLSSPDRARALRQWLLFGALCAVAVCANANGVQGALHPLRFTQLQMLPMIDEWKPSSPKITPFAFGVFAFIVALIAWKKPQLHPARWLLIMGFVAAAALQARHQAMLAIVGAMILPEGFAKSARQPVDGEHRSAAVVVVAGALLLVAVRAMVPVIPNESETNPWKLIASVPPELRSQPVLNNYSMGGPLILSGVRTFIDGRGDMYGDPHVMTYSRIVAGDAGEFNAAVKRWNIRWAIVAQRDRALVALIDHAPGWRRIRQNNVGIVYARA